MYLGFGNLRSSVRSLLVVVNAQCLPGGDWNGVNGWLQGPVVKEIRQSHASWAAVTHRLWKAQPFVESEWTVGPIPIDDGVGREVWDASNAASPLSSSVHL